MISLLLTLTLLCILELSLSFDNAIINASVLKNMSLVWQRRFLTWGIFIATFGMRLVFPLAIVCITAGLMPLEALRLAFNDPTTYSEKMEIGRIFVDAFGGIFLLYTFLSFHCDKNKEIHWLFLVERMLKLIPATPVIVLVMSAICVQRMNSPDLGLLTWCMTASFLLALVLDNLHIGGKAMTGFMGFLYLELLDASCSFDGVAAAFVLTNNIIIISIGLGLGAFAIRSLTLYFVKGKTLDNFVYLEHGAHWGIGALAVIMLIDIFHKVPEPVTGALSVGFIILSLISSLKERKLK